MGHKSVERVLLHLLFEEKLTKYAHKICKGDFMAIVV